MSANIETLMASRTTGISGWYVLLTPTASASADDLEPPKGKGWRTTSADASKWKYSLVRGTKNTFGGLGLRTKGWEDQQLKLFTGGGRE